MAVYILWLILFVIRVNHASKIYINSSFYTVYYKKELCVSTVDGKQAEQLSKAEAVTWFCIISSSG